LVGRGHCWIEEERATLGLAELGAAGRGDEWSRQRVDMRLACLANQLDASGEVAPLVVAAHLHGAALHIKEMQEVGRLEDHVAELGIGDAMFAALDASLDRFL